MMHIIISGYGKMGRLIESRAAAKGWNILAVIDPAYQSEPGAAGGAAADAGGGAAGGAAADAGGGAEENKTRLGSRVYRSLHDIDFDTKDAVGLDFSRPDCAYENITQFARKKIPLVVGTTGWYGQLNEVQLLAAEHGACLLWASNFSLGVNLFYRMAGYAAQIIGKYPEYDISGYEFHHNQKVDSPSGTAKALAEEVIKRCGRKKTICYDKLDRPPAPEELHFASLRCGSFPGTHALLFDSAEDTIELKHTARSRKALVSGALLAAEWLREKAAAGMWGLWTFGDVLDAP